MKKIPLLFILIIVAIPFKVSAGSNDSALKSKVTQWMSSASGIRFLENKGQMMDMQRKTVNNVLFKVGAGGVDIYVTTDGLSYVFTKMEKHKKASTSGMPTNSSRHDEDDSVIIQYCRADMQLAGADIRKENVVKEGESENRTDYYYGDVCPDGILNVHSYGKITIKNIYPGIDWVLHSGKNGLKYDFIVHPGANPSLIRLKYKWTDKPQLQSDSSLKITTPMGTINEGTPVSYTTNKQVQTTYRIDSNEIHFNVSNYNPAQPLTIDPTLVWATYYNGNKAEDAFSMQDDGTNVWVTGITEASNFPALNPGGGAYFQGALTGTLNIFILQFSIAGVLKWATYYGGNIGDEGYSIYSDGTSVWVTGSTSSTTFPTFNPGGGAYFQGSSATATSFILQFSTTGVRKWATYYGGSTMDNGNSIFSDGTNVWVTGYTESTNFPTYNPGGGTYFQGTMGGTETAYILQFNTSGVRKWATYYGGAGLYPTGDVGTSICSDGTHVWVTGFTGSTNFPTFNPGGGAYYQGTLAALGQYNAFILQFDTSGVRKWATYCGGNYRDRGNSINSDGKNVWVTGWTESSNFPTFNPGGGTYFQGTLTAVGNVFILKFNTAGVCKWATYYGGSSKNFGSAEGYSIQSDGVNVWVSGETSSGDFPTFNPGCGFFQDSLGSPGYEDVFILQFDTNGIRKWATYYGQDIENDGSFIWSDRKNLFVSGDVQRPGYPMLNPGGGTYYDTTTNGNENILMGRFSIASLSSFSLVVSPTRSICRGDTTSITASGALSYSWSPAAGLRATNIANPVASPTVTTIYTVTGTGGCAGTAIDSVKIIVDTFKPKNVTLTKDTAICSGSSITLSAGGGPRYQWNTGDTTSSISITNLSTTITYTVSIGDGICNADTTVTVKVIPNPSGKINGNLSICKGRSTTLIASGGTSYIWSTGETTSAITISPSSNTKYSVTIIQNGCIDTTSELVTITTSPNSNVCCDSIVTGGEKVQLISPNGHSYSWSPSTGLSCDTCSNPVATPNQTTTYSVTYTNDSGCIVQGFVTIDVRCGNVFIPDVFSPNESHNNILYVRGTCIASMEFMVFDRWGNKIFKSGNLNDGWNGKYNGQAVNPGTYVWLLKATLQDGTSIERDGNVTLVR